MHIIELGRTDFLSAYKVQMDLVKRVYEGGSESTLVITEHYPTITLGRRASRNNILRSKEYLESIGIKVFNVDRGGDVTYHGPGQIVAYPIFKLEKEKRDIHMFLDFLERVGLHFLSQYGLFGKSIQGFRGIWIGSKKVGSIGIGVQKWVTYHGIAININTDLTPFSFINPCNMSWTRMTSLDKLLVRRLDINDANERLKFSFKTISFLAD